MNKPYGMNPYISKDSRTILQVVAESDFIGIQLGLRKLYVNAGVHIQSVVASSLAKVLYSYSCV